MPHYLLINTEYPDPVAGFDTIEEAQLNARNIAKRTKYIKGGTWCVMRLIETKMSVEVFCFKA